MPAALPRRQEVIKFLLRDPGFRRVWSGHFHELSVARWITEPQQIQPVAAASTWNLPAIQSVGELADWFGIRVGELEWFADLKGLGYKNHNGPLTHYHYRILAKQSGSIRLIEAPKPRLKGLQRQVLRQILEPIPPHPAAHGFLKKRSIRTFVAPHVGQRVVLRFSAHVASILAEEGFRVHHRKTRVMRQGVRQHLAGVVANQHLNVIRTDFDRLKATLTNCVRLGAASQNREGHPHFRLHLEGRVRFVEMVNRARGQRLRTIFERIRWE